MMRVLLLIHGFNALSQRLFVELEEMGHEVSIEFDINDQQTLSAIELFQPDVILAPYLKRAIPKTIWQKYLCLIVHPGPVGDRGPSAIDWAILNGTENWGVTLLQATEEMDAGPVWQSVSFAMPQKTKSSIYRNEVTQAAVGAVKKCFAELEAGVVMHKATQTIPGSFTAAVKQSDRKICWQTDNTRTILRKVRAGDGVPGTSDELFGRKVFLYDAHLAKGLAGNAGEVIAVSGPAICRATIDGAIWIGHLRDKNGPHPFKLPATQVLAEHLKYVPQIAVDSENGYTEIDYFKDGPVGHLKFNFYNGAMFTKQCERLLTAYRQAVRQDTKVIVLHGGKDFWSNGMHLNMIEASASPADESWANINAIDDLAQAIIETDNQITIAAINGNAGAGGVFLARACDHVWIRNGVILNPHYKDMGNLYGSEFWTYLLPRYAGSVNAEQISKQRLPMGARQAVDLGLADASFGDALADFESEAFQKAMDLAASNDFARVIETKKQQRAADELEKPLSQYRAEELEHMKLNFFGFDPSYHVARYNFVYKIAKSRTPVTLARHRDRRLHAGKEKAS